MRLPLLLVAAALSGAPALLGERLGPSLEGCSRLALAAMPWLALAGLPRRLGDGREELALGVELGCALPLLGLGAWLDLRAGSGARELGITALGALALFLPLCLARRRARGAPLHGLAWLALVPGGPALCYALSGAYEPALLLGQASPLGWSWERARSTAETGWEGLPLAPLAAVLALAIAAGAARRGEAP